MIILPRVLLRSRWFAFFSSCCSTRSRVVRYSSENSDTMRQNSLGFVSATRCSGIPSHNRNLWNLHASNISIQINISHHISSRYSNLENTYFPNVLCNFVTLALKFIYYRYKFSDAKLIILHVNNTQPRIFPFYFIKHNHIKHLFKLKPQILTCSSLCVTTIFLYDELIFN